MIKKTETCIIILSWNERKFTVNCLNSIKKNTRGDYKIIVVDNGSQDGSQDIIKKKFPKVDLIELKKNYGFSGGNNIGIKYASKKYNPEYYYFLSNDTFVKKDFLSKILDFAKKHPDGGIFGSKQFDFEKNLAPYSANMNFLKILTPSYPTKPCKTEWVSGAGFLATKEIIKKIGAFDEIYNPAYYEETDWAKRTMLAGYSVYVVPGSVIYHKGSGSEKNYNFNKYSLYYRNRFIYYFKYHKLFILPRFLFDVFTGIRKGMLKIILNGYLNGYKIIISGKFKKIRTVSI